MIENWSDADDEMVALFKAAWDTTTFPCQYPNASWPDVGPKGPWARLAIDYMFGRQYAFGGPEKALFEKSGWIYIYIYTPIGSGTKQGRDLMQTALKAFEGKRTTSDVWFRNVRMESEGRGTGGDRGFWVTIGVADFVFGHK